MDITFTRTDYLALDNGDYDYINNKGAKAYSSGDYEIAIEYYRIAAAMGCVHSISNLGYCYMYARSIPKNMDLAIAYFRLAAARDDVDALYKLGNIYRNGMDEIKADPEMALYYYRKAISVIERTLDNEYRYPSLYFSVAKELMPNGLLCCDLQTAYTYLNVAKMGYEIEEKEDLKYHKLAYAEVLKTMGNPCFDELRSSFSDEDDWI